MQPMNSAALDLDTTASVKAFLSCYSKTASKSRDPWLSSFALVVDTCFSSASPLGLYVNFLTILGTKAIQGAKQNFTKYKECSSSFSYG